MKEELLFTYWLSFPKEIDLPMGIGVTAFSEEDAFLLIREQGISSWFDDATEIHITRNVRIEDLDQSNIVPNIGPMQFRGVWYPCSNIGYGAPSGSEFTKFKT